MSDRGQGIRLFESRYALRNIFESFEDVEEDEIGQLESPLPANAEEGNDTNVIASQLRHFVIQVRAHRSVARGLRSLNIGAGVYRQATSP